MENVTIYTTDKAFNAAKTELATTGDRVRYLTHSMAVSAMLQAEKGNFNWLNDLAEVTKEKKVFRHGAIIEWACEFGKVKYNEEENKFTKKRKGEWKVEAGAKTPYYDFSDNGMTAKKLPEIAALQKMLATAMAKRFLAKGDRLDDMESALLDGFAEAYAEAVKSEKVEQWVEEFNAQQDKQAA